MVAAQGRKQSAAEVPDLGVDGGGGSRGSPRECSGLLALQGFSQIGQGCEGKGDPGSRNSGSGRNWEPEVGTSCAGSIRRVDGGAELRRGRVSTCPGSARLQGDAGGQLLQELRASERQQGKQAVASAGSRLRGIFFVLHVKLRAQHRHNNRHLYSTLCVPGTPNRSIRQQQQ